MNEIAIYLTENLPGYGTEIHRPPDQVDLQPYGAVVQFTEDQTLIIPWSQILYVTRGRT